HEDVLKQIDKSSNAKTIWRKKEEKTPETVT
ncbi:MAG: hypothetical protein RLZZ371_1245, partial [Pseudomonadota bacterium]